MPWADLSDSFDAISGLALQFQGLVAMAMAHPIWAVGLLILAIGLLQIVADLMKRLLKSGLTLLLKSPLSLSQWLWQRFTVPAQNDQSDQINRLLARLDALGQEQDQVRAELKALLATNASSPSTKGSNKGLLRKSRPQKAPSSTQPETDALGAKTAIAGQEPATEL